MPPIIALVLTVAFILFLLRIDRKQNPEASYALWIPSLWILLISCMNLAVWTGTGGGMEEGSALDRIVLSVLFVLGLLILMRRKFNWVDGIKGNRALTLLIGFMLVSTLWADMPSTALKRWFREAGIPMVMAFVVSTEVDPRQALKSVFRRIIYVHIPLSILLIKYYPHLGVLYGKWMGQTIWKGVSNFKNSFVMLCAFAIFYLIWIFIRRLRGLDIPATRYQIYSEMSVFILSIWLFMGPNHVPTYSSTATTALTLGLAALLCLQWLKRRNIVLDRNLLLPVFILIIILYGVSTPFAGALRGFDASELLGRDQTLTGRTEIWAMLIPYAMQKLFFGHGHSSFWTYELRTTIETEAHNGYLDILLNIGLVGLIFWSVFLIASCRKAQQEMTRDADLGSFWFCIILMAVIHNIAESSMISFISIMPAIILFLNVSLQPKEQGGSPSHAILESNK